MNVKYFINLAFKNPKVFAETLLRSPIFTRTIKDSYILKLLYYLRFKKLPNLNNPTTFNEKLLYLTLHDRKPVYNVMVDKFEAKSFINDILYKGGIRNGEEFIIPTYGVYDRFEDISFKSLPNSFVIKTTHDSGSVIIIRDKSEIDISKIKARINKSLRTNYYWFSREWVYKDVKPRIIIEKLLVSDDSSSSLKDYKFFCFNGKPYFVKVDFDRFTN